MKAAVVSAYRRKPPRAWSLLSSATAVFLLGCSPIIRLELRFIAPASVVLDPDRLQVSGAKACPPGPVGTLSPGSGIGQAESFRINVETPNVLRVETRFRGKRCRVQVVGWYDADGSGAVSAGDLSGKSVALDAADRGVFAGNLTQAPDVTLAPVAP